MTDDQPATHDDSMLAAAYHEAGHAVVSHCLACTVRHVEIHYDNVRQRWEGSCGHTLPEPQTLADILGLPEKGAKVAVAGVLAQSKFLAERAANADLRFAEDNDFDIWFAFFSDKTHTATAPGRFVIRMVPLEGEVAPHNHEVDGSLFSGRDSGEFNSLFDKVKGASHQALLKDVVKTLDNAARWNEIGRLARRLCAVECSAHEAKRELQRSEIIKEFAM